MTDANLAPQVRRLCADGYRLYDSGDFRLALRAFYQAWLIIPKPQSDYEEAGWVLTAIGDTYFRLGHFEQGIESLSSALYCPGGDKSPFIQLRLGQCLLEAKREPEARKFLHRAYRSPNGHTLFENEPKRYLDAIADLHSHE